MHWRNVEDLVEEAINHLSSWIESHDDIDTWIYERFHDDIDYLFEYTCVQKNGILEMGWAYIPWMDIALEPIVEWGWYRCAGCNGIYDLIDGKYCGCDDNDDDVEMDTEETLEYLSDTEGWRMAMSSGTHESCLRECYLEWYNSFPTLPDAISDAKEALYDLEEAFENDNREDVLLCLVKAAHVCHVGGKLLRDHSMYSGVWDDLADNGLEETLGRDVIEEYLDGEDSGELGEEADNSSDIYPGRGAVEANFQAAGVRQDR